MTRSSVPTTPRATTLTLGRLHRFIFAYYSHQRGQSQSEIVRMLAESIVRSELNRKVFDVRAFRKFVDEDSGTPADERDDMRKEIDRFLKSIEAAAAPTKT